MQPLKKNGASYIITDTEMKTIRAFERTLEYSVEVAAESLETAKHRRDVFARLVEQITTNTSNS